MSKETKFRNRLELKNDFAPSSYKEWREAATQLLKGRPFDETLRTNTLESIQLEPIYDKQSLSSIGDRSNSSPFSSILRDKKNDRNIWGIAQEIPYASAKDFNAALLVDLKQGQDVVNLVVKETPGRQRATSIDSIEQLEEALKGVDLEKLPLYITAGSSGPALMAFLCQLCKQRGIELTALQGGIATDPLSEWVQTGSMTNNSKRFFKQMAHLAAWAKRMAPSLHTIGVDTNAYHNAGANSVQELAVAIATGTEYLRGILKNNSDLTAPDLAIQTRFSFAIGSSFFMEIAKLRAARLLWHQILAEFGCRDSELKMTIHARTSDHTKTRRDTHTNIVRATAEAIAAVAGGCDTLHVSPFDTAIQEPDGFSRRIARNIQNILKAEAHLDATIDPGGGSWFIETLTCQLAEKAWLLFQKIEEKGGMIKALKEGFPQQEIIQTAGLRTKNITSGQQSIIGVNKHAGDNSASIDKNGERVQFQTETVTGRQSQKLAAALNRVRATIECGSSEWMATLQEAVKAGATRDALTNALWGNETIEITPLKMQRDSEPFEQTKSVDTESHAI